jgi:hypothetical protein
VRSTPVSPGDCRDLVGGAADDDARWSRDATHQYRTEILGESRPAARCRSVQANNRAGGERSEDQEPSRTADLRGQRGNGSTCHDVVADMEQKATRPTHSQTGCRMIDRDEQSANSVSGEAFPQGAQVFAGGFEVSSCPVTAQKRGRPVR